MECGNCHQSIPSNNFDLHEAHCRRNIIFCKLCREPVSKSEYENHVQDEHTPVACECGDQVTRSSLLSQHKEHACVLRRVSCQYCELSLAWKELEAHSAFCGSRTELCERCNKFIQLKDWGGHEGNCSPPQVPHPPVATDVPVYEDMSHLHREMLLSHLMGGNSTGEIADKMLALQLALNDSVLEQGYHQSREVEREVDQFPSEELFETSGSDDIPCEICGTCVKAEVFIEHQNTCNGGLDIQPQVRFPFQPFLTREKTVLPCEFCGKDFLKSGLIQHQGMCEEAFMNGTTPRPPSPVISTQPLLADMEHPIPKNLATVNASMRAVWSDDLSEELTEFTDRHLAERTSSGHMDTSYQNSNGVSSLDTPNSKSTHSNEKQTPTRRKGSANTSNTHKSTDSSSSKASTGRVHVGGKSFSTRNPSVLNNNTSMQQHTKPATGPSRSGTSQTVNGAPGRASSRSGQNANSTAPKDRASTSKRS